MNNNVSSTSSPMKGLSYNASRNQALLSRDTSKIITAGAQAALYRQGIGYTHSMETTPKYNGGGDNRIHSGALQQKL